MTREERQLVVNDCCVHPVNTCIASGRVETPEREMLTTSVS